MGRTCVRERWDAMLQRVRDVLLCLASLCVVLLTALLIWVWASVGGALAKAGQETPAGPVQTEECIPTPEWPC